MAVMRGNFSRGALVDPFANLMTAFGKNGAMATSLMARDQHEMDMLKDRRLLEARDIQESQFGRTQSQQLLMQDKRFSQQDKTQANAHGYNVSMFDMRNDAAVTASNLTNDRNVLAETVKNDRSVVNDATDHTQVLEIAKNLNDNKILAAEEAQRNSIINENLSSGNSIANTATGKLLDQSIREQERAAKAKREADAYAAQQAAMGAVAGQPVGQVPGQVPAGGAPIMGQQPVSQGGGMMARSPLNGTMAPGTKGVPVDAIGGPIMAPSAAQIAPAADETAIALALEQKLGPVKTSEDIVARKALIAQVKAQEAKRVTDQTAKRKNEKEKLLRSFRDTSPVQQSGEAVDIQNSFGEAYNDLYAKHKPGTPEFKKGFKTLMKTLDKAGERGKTHNSMKARNKNVQSLIDTIPDAGDRAYARELWADERKAIVAKERAAYSAKSGKTGAKTNSDKMVKLNTYGKDGEITSTREALKKNSSTAHVPSDAELERSAYEARTGKILANKPGAKGASGKGVGTPAKKSNKILSKRVTSTKVAAKKLNNKITKADAMIDEIIPAGTAREDIFDFNMSPGKINSVSAAVVNPKMKRNMAKVIDAHPQMPEKTIKDIVLWSQKGKDIEDGKVDFSAYKDPVDMLEAYYEDTGETDASVLTAINNLKNNKLSKSAITTSTGTKIIEPGQRQTVDKSSDKYKQIEKSDKIFSNAASIKSGVSGDVRRGLFSGSAEQRKKAFKTGGRLMDTDFTVSIKIGDETNKYTPAEVKYAYDKGIKDKQGKLLIDTDTYVGAMGQLKKQVADYKAKQDAAKAAKAKKKNP